MIADWAVLEMRRAWRASGPWPGVSTAALVAAAYAAGTTGLGRALAEALHPLGDVPVAAAAALFGHLALAPMATRRAVPFRTGWLAAAPVSTAQLGAMIALAMLPRTLAVALPIAAFGVASARIDVAPALSGLLAGVATVWLRGLHAQDDASRPPFRRRRALFAACEAGAGPLPELHVWQRRALRVAWRTGRGAPALGATLAVMPGGTALPVAVALLAGVGFALWCSAAFACSFDVARQAGRLTAALPLDASRFRRGASVFPLRVAALAVAVAGGVGMATRSLASGLAFLVLALAPGVAPLLRLWRPGAAA